MKFHVPQFVDIEDKVFGPLTIKQFIYLAGGGGMSFAFFNYLPGFISFILIPLMLALVFVLAFYKPNNRPFILAVEAGFNYFKNNKLYVWQKRQKKIKKKEGEKKELDPFDQMNVPKLSDSKLSDLSWSLDIKERLEDNMSNN